MRHVGVPGPWYVRLASGGQAIIWADSFTQIDDDYVFGSLVDVVAHEQEGGHLEITARTPSNPKRIEVTVARISAADVVHISSEAEWIGLAIARVPVDPPASAPEQLRGLWSYVQRYGHSDDVAREGILDQSSDAQLDDLVGAVTATIFDAINAYLDATHDTEEAVPYGDLAQAAMEADLVLRNRRAKRK
jgi:hypothetical protein